MEIIDIFIESKNELYEKYNKEIVSNELINYIINRTLHIKKREQIELKLHVTEETTDCIELIKNGIKEEYQKSIKNRSIINIRQFMLLLVGILALVISTFINKNNILHEIIIITGWVPIWESIDLELFSDTKEKQKRRVLKKLMSANITKVISK